MHRGKQQASSNRKFTSSLCLVRPTRRFTRATRGLRGGSTRAPVGARRRAEACPRQPHAGQDPGTDSSRGQDLGLHVHRQSLGLGGSVSTGTRHFRRPPSLRRNGLWEPGWSAAKDRAAQTSEVSEVASGQRPGAALVPVGEAMCPLPCEGGATPADGPHAGPGSVGTHWHGSCPAPWAAHTCTPTSAREGLTSAGPSPPRPRREA